MVQLAPKMNPLGFKRYTIPLASSVPRMLEGFWSRILLTAMAVAFGWANSTVSVAPMLNESHVRAAFCDVCVTSTVLASGVVTTAVPSFTTPFCGSAKLPYGARTNPNTARALEAFRRALFLKRNRLPMTFVSLRVLPL